MDFQAIINTAQQNISSSKEKGKFYSTKFAPPKKMAKEKRLSAGIQKFLEDKKREEEEEEERARQKKKELVARRDPKEQRKIEKSLKVIKSSRKFYSGESTQDDSTVALENEQPDDDDYGYSSAVSDIFHKKLMEKYQKIPEEKKFSSSSSKSRAMTKEEMNRAKDRIKDAFVSKDDGQQPLRQGPQHRTSKLKSNKVISTGSGPSPAESKKNFIKPKPKLKAAPIVDFQQLLKLAEQKQHEEITIDVPTKKEPERLLTSKEKREQEEIEAARKARLKPNRIARTGATLLRVGESSKHDGNNNENSTKKPMNPPPPRPLTKPSISQQRTVQGTADRSKKPAASQAGSSSSKLRDALQTQNGTATKPSSSNKVPVSSSKAELSSNSPSKAPTKSAANGQRPSNDKNRPSTSSREPDRPREFPPKDLMRSREFPPRDLMRGREFPPRDLMRGREFPPKDMMRSREFPPRGLKRPNQLPMSNSRRIEDEDSEYDSEMDDFIDDENEDGDYSSEIKKIFGYDKSRYRDEDFDDSQMESDYRTVMREEFISKKLGIMEDLEDMKMEAEEKKRKDMRKKRKL